MNNKNLKKLLLSIGTPLVAMAPIATAVACTPAYSPLPPNFRPDIDVDTHYVIDGSKVMEVTKNEYHLILNRGSGGNSLKYDIENKFEYSDYGDSRSERISFDWSKDLDQGTLGTYVVTANVKDRRGAAADEVKMTVVVADPLLNTKPTITVDQTIDLDGSHIVGEGTLYTLFLNQKEDDGFSTFDVEDWFKVTDIEDPISSEIEVDEGLNWRNFFIQSSLGVSKMKIIATDSQGLESEEITFIVTVLEEGQNTPIYSPRLNGVTSEESFGSDLSMAFPVAVPGYSQVIEHDVLTTNVVASLNSAVEGTYTATYTLDDKTTNTWSTGGSDDYVLTIVVPAPPATIVVDTTATIGGTNIMSVSENNYSLTLPASHSVSKYGFSNEISSSKGITQPSISWEFDDETGATSIDDFGLHIVTITLGDEVVTVNVIVDEKRTLVYKEIGKIPYWSVSILADASTTIPTDITNFSSVTLGHDLSAVDLTHIIATYNENAGVMYNPGAGEIMIEVTFTHKDDPTVLETKDIQLTGFKIKDN